MLYQPDLFSRRAVVERELPSGSVVRLTLETVGEGQVKVLGFWRRAKQQNQFRRQRTEEGKVLAFESLKLSLEYGSLFS